MIDSETIDFVHALKLKVYKRTLLIALLVILILWIQIVISGTSVISEFYIFPIYAFFCLASLLLFNKYNTRYLSIFESIAFASVFLYYLLFFLSELYKSLSLSEISLQKFLLWIPIIYTLAFLTYPPRKALLLSALFIVSILIPGIGYGFEKRGAIGLQNDMVLLLQIYTSGIVYIALFYALAILKEKFTEADRRAKIMTSRANTDSLTMAYSHAKIRELLDFHISATSSHNSRFSIMIVDVDCLKKINDVYGHSTGDYVLLRIVELLKSNLRENDSLGRVGGDEFLLICPNTDSHQAELLAERLEHAISDTEFDKVGKVTVSIGFATLQQDDSQKSLLKRADDKMYKQKRFHHR